MKGRSKLLTNGGNPPFLNVAVAQVVGSTTYRTPVVASEDQHDTKTQAYTGTNTGTTILSDLVGTHEVTKKHIAQDASIEQFKRGLISSEAYKLLRQPSPVLNDKVELPTKKHINRRPQDSATSEEKLAYLRLRNGDEVYKAPRRLGGTQEDFDYAVAYQAKAKIEQVPSPETIIKDQEYLNKMYRTASIENEYKEREDTSAAANHMRQDSNMEQKPAISKFAALAKTLGLLKATKSTTPTAFSYKEPKGGRRFNKTRRFKSTKRLGNRSKTRKSYKPKFSQLVKYIRLFNRNKRQEDSVPSESLVTHL